MSNSTLVGFFVLLLPVPIALLLRPSPKASPDPRKVRRQRLAAAGFPLFVAFTQLGLYWFRLRIWQGAPPHPFSSSPLFMWAFMAWFFLAFLAVELRLPKREPFPGERQRSASLRPRHGESPIAPQAWGTLAVAWAIAVITALLLAPRPVGGALTMIPAGLLVALGPRFTRLILLGPEPLPNRPAPRLEEAYARRRRGRSWAVFALVVVTLLVQTPIAIDVGWDYPTTLRGLTVYTAQLALLATWFSAYGLWELVRYREIRRLRRELTTQDSR